MEPCPPPTPLAWPDDPPKRELLVLPEFPEENEVPHRLAGEEVVSWKKDSMIGNCKRCSTLMFDPVRFFFIQSRRSSWLVMSFPTEMKAQTEEFDRDLMTLNGAQA